MAQRNIFPRTCIALGLADPMQLLEQGTSEAQAGESFLEFRLDYLDSPERGSDVIRAFLQNHPECIVLATCRRHQNHGKFNGGIREQIGILNAAVQSGAKAVDIEIETAEAAPDELENLRGRARLIV